eukprot:TRINITY_DN29662_c0_g1_i1.p1 TRINITY_DN29662_c0_g1~~TRINITY_DN29662_c0_g1_i1.p1  ORF type:complete len:426 (-),score=74.42 TRINITY_DN29662_c0_g1_i1:914-2155(-)
MASGTNHKIDPLDPRSRLHFIKYVTKDQDTTKCWECGICGKEFKHQYTLVRHLPVHTDERNYQCDQCEKAFRQLSTLTQHKASKHSNSKPYVCEICTKSFSRVSILINHKKTHKDNKSFQCEVCEKAFHQKINLKMHMNIHSNERPYSCSICKKGFNQKSNLAVHQKTCCKKSGAVEPNPVDWEILPTGKNISVTGILQDAPCLEMTDYNQITVNNNQLVMETEQADSNSMLVFQGPFLEEPQIDKTILPKGPDNSLKTYFGSKTGEAVLGDQSALVISPISTPEYTSAVERGQTPFVLFQPCKGPPVIVKVRSLAGEQHLLVPTSAKDFQEKENSGRQSTSQGGVSHVHVPIVALVQQKVEPGGQIRISVASPSNNMEVGCTNAEQPDEAQHIIEEQHVLYVNEEGEIMMIE